MLSAAISIAGLLLTGFGLWIKWRTSRTSEDRLRTEASESEADGLREGLKASHEASANDKKAIVEILDPDLTDERASELLSRPHSNPKVSGSAPARNKSR